MKRGFTLIEILVVVGIMGVLAAVGVASFNTIGDKGKSQQTAQLIAAHLRAAQKDADSGVGAQACTVADPYGGIRVTQAINAPSRTLTITIYSRCGVSTDTQKRQDVVKIPNGTTITWSAAGDVIFQALSKGVTNPPTVTVTTGSYTYTTTVLASGSVNVSP